MDCKRWLKIVPVSHRLCLDFRRHLPFFRLQSGHEPLSNHTRIVGERDKFAELSCFPEIGQFDELIRHLQHIRLVNGKWLTENALAADICRNVVKIGQIKPQTLSPHTASELFIAANDLLCLGIEFSGVHDGVIVQKEFRRVIDAGQVDVLGFHQIAEVLQILQKIGTSRPIVSIEEFLRKLLLILLWIPKELLQNPGAWSDKVADVAS